MSPKQLSSSRTGRSVEDDCPIFNMRPAYVNLPMVQRKAMKHNETSILYMSGLLEQLKGYSSPSSPPAKVSIEGYPVELSWFGISSGGERSWVWWKAMWM